MVFGHLILGGFVWFCLIGCGCVLLVLMIHKRTAYVYLRHSTIEQVMLLDNQFLCIEYRVIVMVSFQICSDFECCIDR